MPRSFDSIFSLIEGGSDIQYLVRVSYLEIYKEDIRDLLAKNPKNKLHLGEKPEVGVYVKELSSFVVKNSKETSEAMYTGRRNRTTAETKMNERSSRSHSIFTITVESSELGVDKKQHIRAGKLNMVDLAGSERIAKTEATGDRLEEATKINLSLSTLCHVIATLTDPNPNQFVPYRNSKLTRLLQDSLGGNTKTIMVANIGPADYNYEESLNTLRYANRAKNIQNKPNINEDPKDAMIREFQEEITKLKAMLAQQGLNPVIGENGEPMIYEKEIVIENTEKVKEMEEKLAREKEELRRKTEEEMRKIEAQKNLAEEEKHKLLQNLKHKEHEKNKVLEQNKDLINKIKSYEEKMIQGKQEEENAKKKIKELKKAQEEIKLREEQKKKLEEELKAKEEEKMNLEYKFSNLKEEIEFKKSKHDKLMGELKKKKTEF